MVCKSKRFFLYCPGKNTQCWKGWQMANFNRVPPTFEHPARSYWKWWFLSARDGRHDQILYTPSQFFKCWIPIRQDMSVTLKKGNMCWRTKILNIYTYVLQGATPLVTLLRVGSLGWEESIYTITIMISCAKVFWTITYCIYRLVFSPKFDRKLAYA